MELNFTKEGNKWVAEFEATSDFNLHIEREKVAYINIMQRVSSNGEYDLAKSFSADKIFDYDLGALVYPKFIKVVSGSEVVKAFVTCPDGEVNQVLPSKYEFVDLGLPSGTMWATCNVGATKPEEYGLFFRWGEIEGYPYPQTDDWGNYKLCNGTSRTLIKYNNDASYGTVDNLTTLELSDDAAYISDNSCRMPTGDECNELVENTILGFVDINGVRCKKLTSKINGNSIFINELSEKLWSSSIGSRPVEAISFGSDGTGSFVFEQFRTFTYAIRPVQIK